MDLYLVQVELGQSPMEHLQVSSPQEEKVGVGSTRPSVDLSVEGDVQVSGVASVADLKFSTNVIESTSGTLSLRLPSGQYVLFDQNLVYFTSTTNVYFQYGIDVFGNGTASNFRGQLNVGSNGAGFGVTIDRRWY